MLSLCHLQKLLSVAALAIGTAVAPAQAAPAGETAARPIAREVVVLVDSVIDNLEDPVQDAAREVLQMPLNYLGLRLVRIGIDRAEAPPDVDPRRVRGVGTWLETGGSLPAWVWPWLERQSRRVRMLHFGSLAPLSRDDRGERLRAHLGRFGLGYDDAVLTDPLRIDVDYVRRDAVPFESEPVYERLHFGPWSLGDGNDVWLRTRDSSRPRRARTPVVTGPWGGLALQPWFVRIGGAAGDRRFYVDPFAFLTAALDLADVPAPDPSVRFGRRVFVLHVDGDGFESVSTVPNAGGERRICAEVFRDRIVDRWRVPMTVSVIVASLTDRYDPPAPTGRMELARDILSRSWVEAASHTVLHPLDWRRQLSPRSLPRSVVWFPALAGYEHDMVAEVRDSIAFVNRWLVPPGKRCRVMLWSGAANPDERAVAAAAAAGCVNLNGDLFRWDELFDSVGFVSPWGLRLGAQFQVFAGAPNENIYDGFYTTMPGAFAHVDRTLENTGRDRILKPANVYVHFYSAEHPARLAALEQLLERWLDREPVFPTFASTYAAAVDDCENCCELERIESGFRCRGFEHCRTLRFERELPPIDWARSSGLAGVHRVRGRTFVHLAAAAAELRFAPDGAPVSQPRIEQADCELTDVTLVDGGVRFAVPAGTRRAIVVAGLPPAAAVEVAGLPAGAAGEAAQQSDADGRLLLRLPAGARVELTVSAAEASR